MGAISRRAALPLILALGALLAGGCPYQNPKPKAEATPPKPTRPLKAGEAETFKFPPDGRWHPTPFMLLNRQVIVIRTVEESEGLSDEAVRFRVGPVPQMLRPGQRVRITMPGPLGFRVDRASAAGLVGPVTVEIKRIQ